MDIAKGIGIILIVLGHNWITVREQGELYRVLFSFHVPLFFYLSGVFLPASRHFGAHVASRFHTLLKPYLVTLTVVGIFKLSYWHFFPNQYQPGLFNYFYDILYGTGRSLFISELSVTWIALWFLPHLFLSSIATQLIIRGLKQRLAIFAYAVVALIVGAKLLSTHDLFWSLDLLPLSSALLCFGYLSRDQLTAFQFKPLPWLLALSAFSALHYLFNETIDLNMRAYGNFSICTAQILLGIYICLGAASMLAKFRSASKALSYIGSGSLFILLFHWAFQANLFDTLLRITGNPYLASGAGLVAGLALPLACMEAAKRNHLMSLLLLPQKRPNKLR